jgi:hypothetical protein
MALRFGFRDIGFPQTSLDAAHTANVGMRPRFMPRRRRAVLPSLQLLSWCCVRRSVPTANWRNFTN